MRAANTNRHCCTAMHANLSNGEVAIAFGAKRGLYGIRYLDGGTSFQRIKYCPWCGTDLRPSPERSGTVAAESVDVLEGLCEGTLSLDAAEAFYDNLMDSELAGEVRERLMLSEIEWTACAQGVFFDELARWRQHGWPSSCAQCGAPVVVEQFGWMAVEAEGGHHQLEHLTCPAPSPEGSEGDSSA